MKRAELNYFNGTSYEIISLKYETEHLYYRGNGSFVGTSFYITGKYIPVFFIISGENEISALYLINALSVNASTVHNVYSNSNQLMFQDDGTVIKYINEWTLNKTEENYKIVWKMISVMNINKNAGVILSDENRLRAMQNINNRFYDVLIV